MTKTVTIELTKPLIGHGGAVTKVVVREPTFREYIAHGDPIIWVPLPNGGLFPSENLDVIAAYIRICVTEPDALVIEQGGFELARKIKDVILGFFLPAVEEAAGSKT